MNELYTRIERMTTIIFNRAKFMPPKEKLVHLGGRHYALEGSALAAKHGKVAA